MELPLELTYPVGEAEQPHQRYPALSREGGLCLNPALAEGKSSNRSTGYSPPILSVPMAALRVLLQLLYPIYI